MIRALVLGGGLILFSNSAHAQLDELEKRAGLGSASGLSESKVASGLKEALRVGTTNLTEVFEPVVKKVMAGNGTTRQYNALADQYKEIPFAKSQSLDIDHYVVTKALDGLFYELAEQEKEIRKNPTARATSLLKEVFANVKR